MHINVALSPAMDNFYNTVEFGLAILAAVWGSFRGFRWVKDIREKDLKNIKFDVVSLNEAIDHQTKIIADGLSNLQTATIREIGELRSDFRTFYTAPAPMMVPVRARKTARRIAAERTQVKPKQSTTAKPKAKPKARKKVK